MISNIPNSIEVLLTILNIVIFAMILLYIFVFWYYDGNKKKIKKFWKIPKI